MVGGVPRVRLAEAPVLREQSLRWELCSATLHPKTQDPKAKREGYFVPSGQASMEPAAPERAVVWDVCTASIHR